MIYKLVKRRGNRRTSAMLPEHLAETYREDKETKIVPKSLAFDNLRDARRWRNRWFKKGLLLEIWTAEAESVSPPPAIISSIEGWWLSSRRKLTEITEDLVPRETWLELVEQAERRGENYWVHATNPRGERIAALPWNVAPRGTVLCTDLKLKRRLLW